MLIGPSKKEKMVERPENERPFSMKNSVDRKIITTVVLSSLLLLVIIGLLILLYYVK